MKLTEQINLFVEPKKFKKGGEEKVFYKLTTSIATKLENGEYLRMPVDIIPNPKRYPDTLLARLDPNQMYKADIKNGWLMVTDYFDKNGKQIKKLCIYIEEMKLTGSTPIDTEKREKALASAKGNAGGQNTDLPF